MSEDCFDEEPRVTCCVEARDLRIIRRWYGEDPGV